MRCGERERERARSWSCGIRRRCRCIEGGTAATSAEPRRGSAKCWAGLDHDVCHGAAGTHADTERQRAGLPARLQSAGLRDAIAGVMRSASRVSIHQASSSSSKRRRRQ